MKRRTRYLFIILGLIIFLIVGPLIVLYVTGISYNWHSEEYVKTGIISIKTDPDKASIILDGKEVDTTPASVRFLEPKEYSVTLKKDGYFDWSKRIDVKAGKATILADVQDKIFLLKRNPETRVIAENVKDYIITDNYLAYLAGNSVSIARGKTFAEQTKIALPPGVDRLNTDARNNYILVYGTNRKLLVEVSNQKVIDASLALKEAQNMTPTVSGEVLFTNQNQQLSLYNPATNQTKILAENIATCTITNSLLYYIQSTTPSTATLTVASLNNNTISNSQTLLSSLTNVTDPRLFITENKDIALWDNGQLYRVNTALELIASDVRQVYFDAPNRTLAYTLPGQFQLYDFNGNNSDLITRNGTDLLSPHVITSIGYAFYILNNTLHAIELDTRDRQNNYEIEKFSSPISMRATPDSKSIIVLDGTTLKHLTIR